MEVDCLNNWIEKAYSILSPQSNPLLSENQRLMIVGTKIFSLPENTSLSKLLELSRTYYPTLPAPIDPDALDPSDYSQIIKIFLHHSLSDACTKKNDLLKGILEMDDPLIAYLMKIEQNTKHTIISSITNSSHCCASCRIKEIEIDQLIQKQTSIKKFLTSLNQSICVDVPSIKDSISSLLKEMSESPSFEGDELEATRSEVVLLKKQLVEKDLALEQALRRTKQLEHMILEVNDKLLHIGPGSPRRREEIKEEEESPATTSSTASSHQTSQDGRQLEEALEVLGRERLGLEEGLQEVRQRLRRTSEQVLVVVLFLVVLTFYVLADENRLLCMWAKKSLSESWPGWRDPVYFRMYSTALYYFAEEMQPTVERPLVRFTSFVQTTLTKWID